MHGVIAFKFGIDIHGLFRPDKFVIYVTNVDSVYQFADVSATMFSDISAQGVPFTATLSEDGLLSWGADPALTEHLVGVHSRTSWRLWVVNRLAVGLIAAQEAFPTDSEQRCKVALERIRLERVDTHSWNPSSDFVALGDRGDK